MKETIKCINCGSRNVVKKGRSKTKFSVRQIYKCKDCNKRFGFGFGKSYPAKIVMDSIIAYNIGNNLAETSKIIKRKFKVMFLKRQFILGLRSLIRFAAITE